MRKFRFFEAIAFILILSLTVLAGISCSKAAGQELDGVSWILKSYGDSANLTAPITGKEPTLTFDKEKMTVSGNGGVNGYGADYTVDGSKLTVTNMAQTLMASTNEALNIQESAFFKILRSAKSFKLEGGQLTITGSEGTLVFLHK